MFAEVEPKYHHAKYSDYAIGGELPITKMAWNVKDVLGVDVDVYIHTMAFINTAEGHDLYQRALNMIDKVDEAMFNQAYYKAIFQDKKYRYIWTAASDNGYMEENPKLLAFNLRVERRSQVEAQAEQKRRIVVKQEPAKIRLRG